MRKHLSLALALVLCLSLLTTGALAAEGEVTPAIQVSEEYSDVGILSAPEYVAPGSTVGVTQATADAGYDYEVVITANPLRWHSVDGYSAGYWYSLAFVAPDGVNSASVAYSSWLDGLEIEKANPEQVDVQANVDSSGNSGIVVTIDTDEPEHYVAISWDNGVTWTSYKLTANVTKQQRGNVEAVGEADFVESKQEDSTLSNYQSTVDVKVRGLEETVRDGKSAYWIGLTIDAPDGAESADIVLSSSSTNLVLSSGEMSNREYTFYTDVQPYGDNSIVPNGYYYVKWLDNDGDTISTDGVRVDYSYTFENNGIEVVNVNVYDGENPSPDVTASVVDNGDGTGTIMLSGDMLGARKKYTLECSTNIGVLEADVVVAANGEIETQSITLEDPLKETSDASYAAEDATYQITGSIGSLTNISDITQGETVIKADSIPVSDKEEVQEALESICVTNSELERLVMENVASQVNDLPDLQDETTSLFPGKNVSIVIEPYLEATAYNEEAKTFSVNISAYYKTYAIAGEGEDNKKEIDIDGASGQLTVTEPIGFSITLPSGLSENISNTVYIAHTKYQRTYYYTGWTNHDDGTVTVTFTSHNGLSPFTFLLDGTDPRGAAIGGVGYGTLQEAIDDADDNAIITLLKNGTAVIDREVTFTINPNGYTANITAANGYRLVENNGVYTVVEDTTPSRPGSSVGSSTYRISVVQPEGGTIETNVTRAAEGDTVRVTATPDEGYHLVYITVDDERISGTSFEMPDHAVEVSAVFERDGEEPPFTDVETGDWFYEYVQYVYENGLMDGVSDTLFNPDGNMTRAMFWAVLARIDGETVTGDTWMEDARAWAMESGVSDGTEPEANVTREMLVTMLYRYAGLPETDGSGAGIFDDGETVSVWAYDAMSWALNNGVITGVSDDMLLPGNTATRAQCAAILMRYMELQAE